MAVAVAAAPAASASTTLGTPSGEHLVAATGSSITIGLRPAGNATGYEMYVSTSKASLYVANIKAHHLGYITSATARITRAGLTYTSAPVYYRVVATRGPYHRWGALRVTGLRPATPTGVRAHTTNTGTYLTWANQNANGYVVTQATSAAMTTNRVTRLVAGRHLQYTPYPLRRGVTYYFRVQASNQGALSGPSAQVHAVEGSRYRDIRILTYNVLTCLADGEHKGDGTVASWTARRPKVVSLIRRAAPDVVNVEEGDGWVGRPQGFGGRRQVDDLVHAMPEFGLAHTELAPTQHGYRRTGNYILYRKSTMRLVGTGGHWSLGGRIHAAYQELQNRATGAKVLDVAPHLTPAPGSARYDAVRERETGLMVAVANRRASAAHVPVVFAGDFNSDVPTHVFDGPGRAMQPAHVVDARDVALRLYNQQYNSANRYNRAPPTFGDDIDYVYVGPGVAVRSWGKVVVLRGHKFIGAIPSDHNPVWATISLPY